MAKDGLLNFDARIYIPDGAVRLPPSDVQCHRTIIAMHDYASRKRRSRVDARSAERV